MKTHNTHHVQGVANDVEWGQTDYLNMSGWGEGDEGNVQVTMAHTHAHTDTHMITSSH